MKNLNLRSLVVGPVMTNCYFLQNKETTELILVDPGAEAERISKMIEKLGKKPVAILLTHGHYDHMMAVNEYRNGKFQFLHQKQKKRHFPILKLIFLLNGKEEDIR